MKEIIKLINVKNLPYRVNKTTSSAMGEPFHAGEIVIGAETRQQSYRGYILIHRVNDDAKFLLHLDDIEAVQA